MAFDAIYFDGMRGHMKAQLIFKERRIFDDGSILEVVIWQVPTRLPPSDHTLKYRLFYGKGGVRLVGYDNERGKGDHRHYQDREESYLFVSVGKLLDDFEADVVAIRGEPI
jgi:hypothetical protein